MKEGGGEGMSMHTGQPVLRGCKPRRRDGRGGERRGHPLKPNGESK